ncbi:MAG: hypothetical protein AAGG80_06740 [Pseudomonadota bacterium]
MLIKVLLVLSCILGLFKSVRYFTKLEASQIPLFTVSSLGILLYLSSLIGMLSIATFLFVVLGFTALCIYTVFWLAWGRKYVAFLSRVEWLYILFFLMVAYIVSDVYFYRWDEFSFWGTVSHYIYMTDQLPNHITPIGYKDYPLGAAVFHYFVYTVMRGFSEPNAYFAQDILLFTPLFCFFNKKSFSHGLIFFLLSIVILACYEKSIFHLMYVDYLLVTFFAGIMTIYFSGKPSSKTLFALLPGVVFLVLIKQVGLYLAQLALVVILFDMLYRQIAERKICIRLLASWGLILLITLGIHASWVNHYQFMQVTRTFSTSGLTVKKTIQELEGKTQRDRLIMNTFAKKFIYAGKNLDRLHISVLGVLVLLLMLQACFLYYYPQRIRWLLIFLLVDFGILIFEFGLLMLYLNAFHSAEAIVSASFGRYSRIGTGIGLLTMLGIFQANMSDSGFHLQPRFVYVIAISLFCFLMLIRPVGMHPVRQALMKSLSQYSVDKKIKQLSLHSKVFLLSSGTNFNAIKAELILHYQYFPRITNSCVNVTLPSMDSNKQDCRLSVKEFSKILAKNQYLFVYHLNHDRLKAFSKFFHTPLQNNQLYKLDFPRLEAVNT